jgi:hypothetical protein
MLHTETLGNCIYTLHENGVHEFILLDNTRETFDNNLVLLKKALEKHPRTTPFREIFSLRGGMPSVSYAWHKTQNLLSSVPGRPVFRTAFLHQPGVILSLVQPFLKFMPAGDRVRFFEPDQHEQAMQWLLEDEK